MTKTNKKILDACCGSRMFWFDKNNPDVLFQDIREEDHTLCDGRTLQVRPDVVGDFRKMDFKSRTFNLVVFDPPHLKQLGKTSWMAKKYGVLNYHWRDDLKLGFQECMRVLKTNGILIFKWNESQIKISDILELFPQQPLFGHTSGKNGMTIWLAFMKESAKQQKPKLLTGIINK